jgi:hypothetical protein
MVSKLVRKWIALGLLGATAPLAGALGQEAAPEPAPPIAVPTEIVLQESPQERADNIFAFFGDLAQAGVAAVDEAPPHSEYYIGIALGELPEVVKTQFKLEHGLVVDDVIEGSPAAKAEFKVQDILIRAGETKIEKPADILKAVDEAKDKEMRIIVLRDGKELALQVTPAKRPKPEGAAEEAVPARLRELSIKKIEEALRELKGEGGAAQALELHFAHPGVVPQRTLAIKLEELPKNLKISITRDGDGPAKIHVEREGKEWNATSDKLTDLPEDVRGQVEQMLNTVIRPMLATRARAMIVGGPKNAYPYSPGTPGVPAVVPLPVTPGTPVAPPMAAPATAAKPAVARIHAYRVTEKEGSLEAKVDQILKKLNADDDSQTLEKLRDEVERLRKEVDALKNK